MKKSFFIVLAASLLMVGCVQQPTTQYEWGGYQASIYNYFVPSKHDVQEQIATLETTIEKAQAQGSLAAPGLHAHLALLYFNVGRDEDGVGHLVTEKQLFPESAAFVNFMLEKQGQFE